MHFLKYVMDKRRVKATSKVEGESDYHIRHCFNYEKEPKALMNHFLYHVVDYDRIVDLELQKPYAEKLEGYNIYSFDSFMDVTLKQPFYKIVNKRSGADMKVVLIGAPLFPHNRERLNLL